MNDTKIELCMWALTGGGSLGVALAAVQDKTPTSLDNPPLWLFAAAMSAVSLPFLAWHFSKLDRLSARYKLLATGEPVQAKLQPQP
jgi:hypothetical protein